MKGCLYQGVESFYNLLPFEAAEAENTTRSTKKLEEFIGVRSVLRAAMNVPWNILKTVFLDAQGVRDEQITKNNQAHVFPKLHCPFDGVRHHYLYPAAIFMFLEIKITRYDCDAKNFSNFLCSSSGLMVHIFSVSVAMILEKLYINFIKLYFLKKQYFHVFSISKTLPRCFWEIYAIPGYIKFHLEKQAPSGFECSPESKPKEI